MIKSLLKITLAACCAIGIVSCGGEKMTKSGLLPSDFDSEYNGAKTGLYVLTNENGMEVCITNFGGRIVSIMAEDKDGNFRDVVLGFDKVSDYFPENNASDFGASIGRYANRINQGKFTLDGVEYQLLQNDGNHSLHGGPMGWQYQVYEVVEADSKHVKLLRNSPDMDQNYPGAVKAYVTYTLTDDNKIDIKYEATSDAPTIINMTNHSYFNLAGDPANHSVEADVLYVNSSSYTPVDDTFMPTGEIHPTAGTPMDFSTPTLVGKGINDSSFEQVVFGNGYDHNWILDNNCDINTLSCKLVSPESGIALSVYTNEPGVQVYSGNFLDGSVVGKKGITYNFRTGICLETQHYPNSPNEPEWPSTVLRPGETYFSHCIFAFSVEK